MLTKYEHRAIWGCLIASAAFWVALIYIIYKAMS
ncbi:hypothetical protein C121_11 [Stenotrophomonas phage C121]|nr:hypothetical protein PP752_gp11 [Stenotrophomonas phage C121]UKL14744.1 hypothetical protein C121_11 [Stenotrophomonas phage C121]